MADGRIDLKQVLLEGVARVEESNLSATARALLPMLLGTLAGRRSRDDLSTAIQRIRADLRSLDGVLATVQQRLDEAVTPLTSGSDANAWWRARQRQIETAENDGDDDHGLSLWVDAFTEALTAGEAAVCVQIIGFGDQRSPELAGALTAIIAAVGSDFHDAVPGALDLLLAESVVTLTTSAAVRLGVLRTRALLANGDLEPAARAADAAIERAQHDQSAPSESLAAAAHLLNLEPESTQASPAEALALAARAEVYLKSGELDQARRLVNRALRIVAAPADVRVVAGMVAEADEAWALADDHYGQALTAGADGRPSLMLRPTPARLKVADARNCRDSDPELAVSLYESALREGVVGDEDQLIADLHVELARLLEPADAGRAAASYADAANSYTSAGLYARAAEYFGRACTLQPNEARYWWWRAEVVRLQAVPTAGVADQDMLRQALELLMQGWELADPDVGFAWVLVTRALIEAPVFGHRLDQLVLMERSLLLDDDYLTGYFFLIDQLRERGYAHDAYAAARQRHARTPWDSQSVVQLVQQCIELEQYDEAENVVGSQLWLEPENVDLLYMKALILVRQNRADKASDVLRDAATTPWIRLMRAYAHALKGDYEAAQREFGTLYANLGDSDDLTLQGWAAFQSGSPERLDEAIEIYQTQTTAHSTSSAGGRDLGQMLLVRGNEERGDLEEGERLLRTAVADSNLLDELLHLETLDLDLVRHRLHGKPHEQRVTALLKSLTDEIRARRRELRQRRLEQESTAGMLAYARTALAESVPGEALQAYRALLSKAEVPAWELLLGARRAADALLLAGDNAVGAGRLDEAELSWDEVDAVSEQLPALALPLAARRCLAHSVEGRLDRARAELVGLLADEEAAAILAETARVFASQPSMLWAMRAGFVELGMRDDSLTQTQRAQLTATVERLPFSQAYRLGRGNISVRTAAPLVVLEVLLGANHHDLADSAALNRGIPELRDQIAKEMGVRIQGVRVTVSDDIDRDRVEFRLFGEVIGHVFLTPGTLDRVRPVLERLEKRLCERLYRLIGPDDINLWLEDWAPGSTSASREVLSYSRERRLALARMLRMLLREGVPISDRDTLLKTFQESDPSSDPLTLLRTARVRLSAEHPALSPPPQRFPLPKRIEDRIREGLAESGDRWELDRAETTSVVRVLREWLADRPAARKSIVVADPQTRPFIWRLLAAEPQPVSVFSEEELV